MALPRAHVASVNACETVEEVFGTDTEPNENSRRLVDLYNDSHDTKLNLTETRTAYESGVPLEDEKRKEIHDHIRDLVAFALDHVALKSGRVIRKSHEEHETVIALLRNIEERVFYNTMEVDTVDKAIDKICYLERQSPEAQEVTKILGPNCLRCADRIREQIPRLGSPSRERITTQFLMEKVWPAYVGEIHKLHAELTNSDIAMAMKMAYRNTFYDGGLPRHVDRLFRENGTATILIQNLYRELGVFIAVSLMDSGDSADPESFFAKSFAEIVDDDPAQFVPSIMRSVTSPWGTNMELTKQRDLAGKFNESLTDKDNFSNRGKLEIVAYVQQAAITGETQLYGHNRIRLAAKPASRSDATHFTICQVHKDGSFAGRKEGTITNANTYDGFGVGPTPVKLV